MAVKKPTGALPKGGGQAASGTKLVQPAAPKPTAPKTPAPKTPTAPKPVTPVTPSGPTAEEIAAQIAAANAAATAAQAEYERQQNAAAEAEKKRRTGQSAYDLLLSEFNRYGLGSLLDDVKNLIVTGADEASLTLALRQTPAYQARFAANAARINKGLRALSEAEYIGLEDQYQNIMRNYGLPATYYSKDATGKQAGFEKFIAGDVSPTELEERVLTAQSRVLNAPPQVKEALQQFYPDINNSDILAYTLDPEKGLSDIKRKVTAGEIQAAAAQQGLNIINKDTTQEQIKQFESRARELAGYGVTGETARQGFQAAVPIIERGRQLSSFYGESPYTQATAEEELFGLAGASEATRKRKRLTALEEAQFAGRTGMTGGALSRERAGSF
jgi:hypothetical protein